MFISFLFFPEKERGLFLGRSSPGIWNKRIAWPWHRQIYPGGELQPIIFSRRRSLFPPSRAKAMNGGDCPTFPRVRVC